MLLIYPQNFDNTSFDLTKSTLNHTHWTLHTMFIATLFKSNLSFFALSSLFKKSDPPLFDLKKIDKKPVDEFL